MSSAKTTRFLSPHSIANPDLSHELPPDVFVLGESRPEKPKKKVNKANNKRNFEASGLDVCMPAATILLDKC